MDALLAGLLSAALELIWRFAGQLEVTISLASWELRVASFVGVS